MVRTRIAPSPTGFPHIGTIYQVLFDYAFAKKNNGHFIVRLEDTDRNRFVEGSEQVIYDSLRWFSLIPNESPEIGGPYAPYRQSERLDIYKKYADELIEKGHAYYCFCTRERLEEMRKEQMEKKVTLMYDKHCRNLSAEEIEKSLAEKSPYVVRMKIPENRKITFNDLIIGDIEFDSSSVDDQVILKSDGFPTYHLGVVVDDHLMEITHIFRGREWISSTPKHVLLYEFFGWQIPLHGHLPLILNSDGKGKLSKRHGHASVDFYKNLGFLPEAVLNYLSNLVWYHPENKEIYTIEEFIELLDITKINSQGARFDLTKLEWMNGEYIRKMQNEELRIKIYEFYNKELDEELIGKTIPLIKERIKKLSDYLPLTEFLFKDIGTYEVDLTSKKDLMQKIYESLKQIHEWNVLNIGEAMVNVAKENNVKNSEFFMLLRVAITGKKISPPLNESMEIMGKEKCLDQIKKIIQE
ncbi:MAG TPA: glutamate--tRNA ligase [Candidatus Nitrosocosmicus sp.]|nr:glutamate--tRNA ligase [Candidatus Nitrosocosmicus sp.]